MDGWMGVSDFAISFDFYDFLIFASDIDFSHFSHTKEFFNFSQFTLSAISATTADIGYTPPFSSLCTPQGSIVLFCLNRRFVGFSQLFNRPIQCVIFASVLGRWKLLIFLEILDFIEKFVPHCSSFHPFFHST